MALKALHAPMLLTVILSVEKITGKRQETCNDKVSELTSARLILIDDINRRIRRVCRVANQIDKCFSGRNENIAVVSAGELGSQSVVSVQDAELPPTRR
jgi:hypothetical protein